MKVLVAGGSIGGLTTALLLRHLGIEVEVFERSNAALQERGTGIVVLPITEKYLVERRSDHQRPSLELTDWSYVDRSGRLTHVSTDHFRFSGWNTIYRALLDAFGPECYHLDSEMVGFDRRDDGVTLHLGDGRRIEGDLLVCADGIASTARSILDPSARPTYAGYVAWRGVTREQDLSRPTLDLLADAMVYQVLDQSHILAYAIPDLDGDITPGRRIINTVWYRNAPDDGAWDDLMTDSQGVRRAATVPPGLVAERHIEEMHRTACSTLAPQLAEVVLACPEPLIQAIFDLEVERMVYGRVLILGDAAFGLRPHVAAGQAKACADAWALMEALQEENLDIDRALKVWEPRQLALGRHALHRTRQMGLRSQVENAMVPGDPTWKFGLWDAGN